MLSRARTTRPVSALHTRRLEGAPRASGAPRRHLHLHEFQGQDALRKFQLTTPAGAPAVTADEAGKVAAEVLRSSPKGVVVKAQVLAGGRGLGHFSSGFKSGVHVVKTAQEATDVAGKMLGQRLITKQTGSEGRPCNTVLVSELIDSVKETYAAFLLDRASGGPVAVVSSQGGVEIENLAAKDPNAIFKLPIDVNKGLSASQALQLATKLGFTGKQHADAAQQLEKLYEFFTKSDATLMEVNPLVQTRDGRVVCLDAKINIDDNAGFRQKDLFSKRDLTQEDPRDVAALHADINFIGLDGNIGCLVNGAGLAMATMDIIKLKGGSPANFLDVGGGATEKQIIQAFQILQSDKKVKAILVNIFGGIMRCDIIALGILGAVKSLGFTIPLVVRLAGTNVNEARRIIESSGLRVLAADHLDDAAEKAVRIAEIINMADQVHLKVSFELPL